MKIVLKKDFALFLIMNLMMSIGLGMFLLVFNLHINSIMTSTVFLSNFLFLGNVSMAVGGILLGKFIDLYSKKAVLLIDLVFCLIMFAAECLVTNQYVLYVVSILYGLSYAVFMSIGTPFILEYVKEEEQKMAFSMVASVKLLGVTLGTLIGGGITAVNGVGYLGTLITAVVCYAICIIPILFIRKHGINYRKSIDKEYILKETGEKKIHKWNNFQIAIIFLCLGLLIFLSPYMNLYLENRYGLDILQLSVFLSILEIIPVFTNIIFSKATQKIPIGKIIFSCLILDAVLYAVLALVNVLYIQIIVIIVATAITSFVFPLISMYIMKEFNEKYRGRISGYVNFWYNLGDSVGTYSEGILIKKGLFGISFGIASFLFLMVAVIVKGWKK